jgi:hypothetical protein
MSARNASAIAAAASLRIRRVRNHSKSAIGAAKQPPAGLQAACLLHRLEEAVEVVGQGSDGGCLHSSLGCVHAPII